MEETKKLTEQEIVEWAAYHLSNIGKSDLTVAEVKIAEMLVENGYGHFDKNKTFRKTK